MGKRKNLVSFLLDRTGSMASIWEPTIDGFNEFLAGQKALGYKTVWNLTVFDSESIDLIRHGVKGKDMEPLTYSEVTPRSLTPLHDAIAQTIHATDRLAGDYDGVIFVILTDGMENASREYDLSAVHNLIREREDKNNWQFIFLGANMDAYRVGQDYGIRAGSTVTFEPTKRSVADTYGVAGATTANYAATGQTQSAHWETTGGETKKKDTEEVSNK